MRKLFSFLIAILLLSCSTDNSSTTQNSFIFNAVASSVNVTINEEFTVTLTCEGNMTGILYSFDNFVTQAGLYSSFGNSKALKFNLDKLGVNTIYFKVTNQNNEFSNVEAVSVNVNRGNAIKITGLQVVSFNGINTTWDPEYPITDINHLADVVFTFYKSKLNSPFENQYSFKKWYTSLVKQNQGDLTWNIAAENLFIRPEMTIRMGLADEDNPPLGQDLMMGPPDYRDFNFNDYMITKPNTITFTYPEINLEFIITVEWPD